MLSSESVRFMSLGKEIVSERAPSPSQAVGSVLMNRYWLGPAGADNLEFARIPSRSTIGSPCLRGN